MTEIQNFSNFFLKRELTKKENILKRCADLHISPYIDDSSESVPVGGLDMRSVASEAELEKRINEKCAIINSAKANKIAFLALVISAISMLIAFVALFGG